MIKLEMNHDFQTMFPTVSKDEFALIEKMNVNNYFKTIDELYKWLILRQIDKPDLSLYVKCTYAMKLQELIEEFENKHIEPNTKPYIMPMMALVKMTHLSRDCIEKIRVIHKRATQEQKDRLLDNEASLNQVFYELKPDLKKSPKGKTTIVNKICKECGIEKPITSFYKGRGICKLCYNEKEYGSNYLTDAKGNVIKISEEASNLTKKYSNNIENDLYDTEKEISYTIEDMEDEINSLINYFERNINNCIKLHEALLNNEENRQAIINLISKSESSMKVLKGMLSHEQKN